MTTLRSYVVEHGPMGDVREPRQREGVLTDEDRLQVFLGIERGQSDAEIGRVLGRHRGTIGREIKRNGGRDAYRPHLARFRAGEQTRRPQQRWFEEREWLWEIVVARLRDWWSPEQIAVSLRFEHPDNPDWHVSHESIYQAIYVQAKGTLKDELVASLRTQRSERKPHPRATRAKASGQSIPDLVPISERPAEAQDRAVPGHWEGDLIVGANNGSAIATIVERTTRFGFMVKLDSKEAAHVASRVAEETLRLGDIAFVSLTWDRGSEMAAHAKFTMATGVKVYFADPHSPWQRGTNENWNKLARQYFPKGTDLSVHTQADLDRASHSLNTRPRKTLDWATPALRFNQLVAATP